MESGCAENVLHMHQRKSYKKSRVVPVLEWKHPPAVNASSMLLQSVMCASNLERRQEESEER